jgi:hypothetical protein
MSSSVRLNSDCSKRRFAKIHQRLRNGRDDPDEDAITSHHSLSSTKNNSLLLRVYATYSIDSIQNKVS